MPSEPRAGRAAHRRRRGASRLQGPRWTSAPLHKPVGREWTLALALALALALSGLLAASGELTEAQDANARMVSEVRAVLADPGRVADDRQYALEQIESIVLAGGAS